ncbi:hypothetical protein [Phenylobacterium sp.]|uniref:hypothetical protein n=1 Tax=Phenylobacterium sp. TaxID=1871053 RepID=UPI0039834FC9
MPQVIVRKRLGRRSGTLGHRVNRWFYRNRPQVAVIAAFAVACLLGMAAASIGLKDLDGLASQPAPDTSGAR